MPLKIDFHVHSNCSYDSAITPKEIIYYARRSGLDGVAITDHDRIDCALKIACENPFLIIAGIEISSLGGHIIAFGISEPIPKGRGVDETVDRIHEKGGIAVACHPSALFKESLGRHVTSKFDAVEVVNSSSFPFSYCVKRNKALASTLGVPKVAGSDAHYGPEIGYAYTLVDAEPQETDVLLAIKKGLCKPVGRAIPFQIRLKRAIRTLT
ncbi:MAG: PHP-associated domain-containing protein [Candidatus Bathyarchaeota archaeon]|nr:PHP-associated domain-containing protein [Candidatus Bathyarchaeota archaeon]